MYQLFVRRFETNNFPDCSNMWHDVESGTPAAKSIPVWSVRRGRNAVAGARVFRYLWPTPRKPPSWMLPRLNSPVAK
jgi:hypothetical protein